MADRPERPPVAQEPLAGEGVRGAARALDHLAVVLHQPEDLVNVASVVRVMTNFGLRQLRLVEPAAFDAYRIEGIAHGGQVVLAATRRFATLEAALSDCGLVLATTGRPREVARERLTPREAGRALVRAALANPGAPAAVLFGRERDGLPNAAIDMSHALVTIPTDPRFHSLNLSHAVAIIVYEAHVAWLETMQARPAVSGAPPPPAAAARPEEPPPEEPSALLAALEADRRLAVGTEREAMFAALAELLAALHPFTAAPRRHAALSRLRAILLRGGLRAEEAQVLTGFFLHMARIARRREPGPAPAPSGPEPRPSGSPPWPSA